MASTGLLGINPYRGGNVAIDITSKPTQLAIGLMQKQRAQAEATEKYFKDYEKSLNPAGLGKDEVSIFGQKLKEFQENGIKNKQAINNPSKYGYDAQSDQMARAKDLQTFIEQSKQATAERKALVDFYNQNKKLGKRISDDYMEVYKNAFLPVGAGYVAPDYSKISVYDPHDDIAFVDKTWKGIPLPVTMDVIEQEFNGIKTGRVKPVEIETITPEVAKTYAQRARGYYRNNLGTQEQYNELIKDVDFVNQLNPAYNKNFGVDIKNAEDLAVAYGLASKQPQIKEKGGFDFTKEYYFKESQKRADVRAAMARAAANKKAPENQGNLFDDIPDVTLTNGGYIRNGQAYDKNGNPYTGKVKLSKSKLSAQLFTVLGNPEGVNDFEINFENGTPNTFSNKRTGVITRQGMANYQLKYNNEPIKGEQMKFGKPASDGKKKKAY
jgi:hypothetical protein